MELRASKDTEFKLLNPWNGQTPGIYPEIPVKVDKIISGHLNAGSSVVFSTVGAEKPIVETADENTAVRTIRFENGGGAILGKPEYSDYYRFLEELRGTTGDEIRL